MNDTMKSSLQVRVDKLEKGDNPIYEADGDSLIAGPTTPEVVTKTPSRRVIVPMEELTPERLRVIANTMDLAIEDGRSTGILVVRPKDWHGMEVGFLSA